MRASIIGGGIAIAALIGVAMFKTAVYPLATDSAAGAYVLHRLTGQVQFCVAGACRDLREAE